MNLLLDTHVLLWWLGDDSRLGGRARELIADPANTVYLSAVVMWEIRIKQGIGKLEVPVDFPAVVMAQGFTELAVTIEHTESLAGLPMNHRDPFDRMLVAQARAENLAVISGDEIFGTYDVTVVPA